MKPCSHALYHSSNSFDMLLHVKSQLNYIIFDGDGGELKHYPIPNPDNYGVILHMDAEGFLYRFNIGDGHDPLKLIENFKPVVKENI